MKSLIVLLVVLFGVTSLTSIAGSEPKLQIVNDDFHLNKKESLIFYNEVEIRILIDSTQIIIPAKTAGTLYEVRGDERGDYYIFVVKFILKNETTCTISFLRKELVEKRVKVLVKNKNSKEKIKKVITNPKTFVLRGKAKTLCRGHEYLSIPSIPKDSENCALMRQKIE